MAFVDSSKTQVVGTEGCSEKFENLNMGYGEGGYNFGRIHSAQFVLELQRAWDFWVELTNKFKVEQCKNENEDKSSCCFWNRIGRSFF